MSRARLAERLWTASNSDPVLLHELWAAWRGHGDVRDALWWHAHPLTSTPAGTPDPTAELRALQAAVYSREGVARAGDEERLQALAQERSGNARALAELLDRFEGWSGGHEGAANDEARHGRAGQDSAGQDDLVDLFRGLRDDGTEPPRADPGSPAPPPPSRRQAALLLSAGILLGVIGTLGVQAAVESPPSTPAPPLSFAAESAAPLAAPSDPAQDPAKDPAVEPAFQIFAQPPARLDHPLPFLGPDVIVGSIRPIASFYSFDTYAARNTRNEYCLYIHGTAQGLTGGGCTTRREILAHGSRSGVILKARTGDPDFPRYIDVTVSWLRDGSFQTDVAQADHP